MKQMKLKAYYPARVNPSAKTVLLGSTKVLSPVILPGQENIKNTSVT